MADARHPISSLSRAREEKINELSTYFANDDLTLEELERRIERVYKATSVAELDTITLDLARAAAPAQVSVERFPSAALSTPVPYPAPYPSTAPALVPERGKLLSLMSSLQRRGRWVVPRHLKVTAVMSDAKVDLRQAVLADGVTEIELRNVMAAFRLIVPSNVRVVNEVHAVMASVNNRADELARTDLPATTGAPVIRLTGYAVMADVHIVVRRPDDPIYEDED